jgi:signal transduction histidine kinase/Tfp pilus assembly protein PilF
MIKTNFTFLLCLLILFPCFRLLAGNNQETHLADSTFQSSDVKQLLDLAKRYITKDPAKGLEFAREAAKVAMATADNESLTMAYHYLGESFGALMAHDSAIVYYYKHIKRLSPADSAADFSTHNQLGSSYHFLNRQDSALYFLQIALDIALMQSHDEFQLAAVYNNLAMVYDATGNFDLAVDYYMDALKIFERLGEMNEVATLYNNIGTISYTTDKFDKSIEYFKKALQISKELGNDPAMVMAMINLGNGYKKNQQFDEAEKILQDAILLSSEAKLNHELTRATLNLGTVYYQLKDYTNAHSHFLQAYNLSVQQGLIIGKLYAGINLAQTEIRLGNLESAGERLKVTEQIIIDQNYDSFKEDLFMVKSEMEEAKGNFQQAIHYFKLFKAFKDSVSEAKNVARMEELLVKYETEKKSLENQQLRDKNIIQKKTIQNQQLLVGLLVAIFLLFAGHLITIIISRKKLARVNKQLTGLNSQLNQKRMHLAEANETKDRLFSIIAHDLRSPFNSLLGFLELLVEDFDSFDDDEKLEIIESVNKQAVTTFGLLENLLQWSMSQRGLFQVNMKIRPLFPIIASQLEELVSRAEAKKLIIENNVSPEIEALVDKEMTQTIFRNLINNSIKFTGQGGKITITAITQNELTILNISDTGIGMSDEIANRLFSDHYPESRQGTESEKGTGLGLMIVKDFIEKQNAQIKVQSKTGEGSTFTILFKNRNV